MKRPYCLTLMLLLPGCLQGPGSFPSLAPRPYEITADEMAQRPDEDLPAPTPPVTTPLSYEQRQAVAAAQDKHRAADAAFRAALPEVRRLVDAAAGAAQGTENWVVAQQSLSRLEALRTPSAEALADLDRLLTERLQQEQQGAAGGGVADIGMPRAMIAEAVAEQSAIIAGLSRRIG